MSAYEESHYCCDCVSQSDMTEFIIKIVKKKREPDDEEEDDENSPVNGEVKPRHTTVGHVWIWRHLEGKFWKK